MLLTDLFYIRGFLNPLCVTSLRCDAHSFGDVPRSGSGFTFVFLMYNCLGGTSTSYLANSVCPAAEFEGRRHFRSSVTKCPLFWPLEDQLGRPRAFFAASVPTAPLLITYYQQFYAGGVLSTTELNYLDI